MHAEYLAICWALQMFVQCLTVFCTDVYKIADYIHFNSCHSPTDSKITWHVKVEKLRMQREFEERQEQQAFHYEDRITELQSVIAELRKKIDLRHINMILYV